MLLTYTVLPIMALYVIVASIITRDWHGLAPIPVVAFVTISFWRRFFQGRKGRKLRESANADA